MTMNTDQSRLFVIHAGTHKTASSYIQSRMAKNRDHLERAGVLLRYPSASGGKHKPLSRALQKGNWPVWRRYLRALPKSSPLVLISGEQFTQPLACPDRCRTLTDLLATEGFGLQVVVFLRDQADYINARFVHSTRRLYHHQSFTEYVSLQLSPERKHIYDYNALFSALMDNKAIASTFLPYGSQFGDPFDRLLKLFDRSPPPSGWRPADPNKGNVQPGCQGVWLAQQIGKRLEQLGVSSRSLRNTGGVVRRIAHEEGWQADRYCGFDDHSAARVSESFADSNAAFADRAWNCSWRDRMPVVAMRRLEYQPPAHGIERQRLEALVDRALFELSRHSRPLARVLASSKSLLDTSRPVPSIPS
jgi:hypothetical protein